MTDRYRWAWFALAALLALASLWTGRYEYQACDTDGCVAVNRWTGRIRFEPSEEEGGYGDPPGAAVVLSR